MKRRILAIVLSLCMVLTLTPCVAMAATGNDFKDTDGHWAEAHIDRWADAGVVNGVSATEFDPNGNMTRAQAAQLFVNLLKLQDKADITAYGDVNADAWYADAIAKCVAAGIMNGTSTTTMDPNATITREMFFVMFARALGIRPEANLDKSFDDANKVSDWAQGYVNALINNGYVSGMTDKTIEPSVDINRASVMALLDKTVTTYVTEEGATVDASTGGIILVVANNVVIENAPEGTTIVTTENATGTTANGNEVAKDTVIVVEKVETPVVPSTGGSTGGGSISGGTTGGSTTGGSTTGGSTTGGSTTGGSTTGGSTTGGSTTGGSTTGGSTTGGSTTGGTTTGASTTGNNTTD